MTDHASGPHDKKALKALLDPPHVRQPPPTLHVHMAPPTHPLHERMAENGAPDSYRRYKLALRAEPLRQESRMHRFLCASAQQLPEGADYILDAMRKAIRHCHGRALWAHEPGLGGALGLAMLLQEYLLRGLVHRAMVLVPPAELGYWEARLNASLDEPFVAMETWPAPPAEGGALPNRLLLSAALFQDELPEHMAKEGHYQMIAVTSAEGLKRRRSRPWRNLLSLSPAHMLLMSPIPFEEKPVELHGYLALLGVPELPPAARLRRELGPPDSPITPETRQMLRPFLGPVALRNTHPTTPLQWAPRQWKTIEVEAHAPTQRLRGQIRSWIKRQQPVAEPSEDGETPPAERRFQPLLEAAQASAAAIAEVLETMRQDDALSEHHGEFDEWIKEAQKQAPKDPRLPALKSLLRESPNSRALIFCSHRSTAAQLEELLAEFDQRPVGSSLSGTMPDRIHAPEAPTIYLATDQEIAPSLQGPFDLLLHFDLPWDGVRLDARSHWQLHQHESDGSDDDRGRQICSFVRESSHDAQLLDALDFRLKLAQIAPGELPLIERYMEADEGLIYGLWALLDENTGDVIDALSKQLLNARKQYRRLLDLNQRLFLDDYAL